MKYWTSFSSVVYTPPAHILFTQSRIRVDRLIWTSYLSRDFSCTIFPLRTLSALTRARSIVHRSIRVDQNSASLYGQQLSKHGEIYLRACED